jgi:hypothetical protein
VFGRVPGNPQLVVVIAFVVVAVLAIIVVANGVMER